MARSPKWRSCVDGAARRRKDGDRKVLHCPTAASITRQGYGDKRYNTVKSNGGTVEAGLASHGRSEQKWLATAVIRSNPTAPRYRRSRISCAERPDKIVPLNRSDAAKASPVAAHGHDGVDAAGCERISTNTVDGRNGA